MPSVTFNDMCSDLALRQTVAGVEVRCPSLPAPVLVIEECHGATARWDRVLNVIVLSCAGGNIGLKPK